MEEIPPVHLKSLALAPGDVLGRHELLMPIAKGGMGQVWAARLHGSRGFQKLVAVKTILPSGEDAGNLESMLFEEASLAALVRHPNVVETLDLGEREDGTLYLVMEWVSGEPLDHILRAAAPVGGVPTPMLVHFAMQALTGLRAVHEASNPRGEPLGIVHRDVSPQNLLVTYEGIVKLIDFGIAKATQQTSRSTEEGMVKGKFAYMSPEQLRSEPIDARADLFSLGVVLYRITTGAHPFQAGNVAATIRNILMAEPQKPTELVPGYSVLLEQIVLKALSKERSERFESAQEMLLALEQAAPEARASGIDKQCEAFLRQLFHERIAERTRALQSAMNAANELARVKVAEPDPRFPRSHSTMRAVARPMDAGENGRPAEPGSRNDDGEAHPTRGRAIRRAFGLVGIAAGVGALVATGVVGSHGSASSYARHAGAEGAEGQTAREAQSASGEAADRPLEPPVQPSQTLPPPSSSPGSFAPADASAPNPSRFGTTPRRRAPQLVEPAAIASPPRAAPLPREAATGTAGDADPLSRRR